MNKLIIPNEIKIVVIGSWNTNIFQPNWIYRHLISDELKDEIKPDNVKITFNPIEKELGFDINKVKFLPRAKILEIVIQKDCFNDNNLKLVDCLLNRTFKCLPHTPIIAMGINYHYYNLNSLNNINLYNFLSENVEKRFADFCFSEMRISKSIENDLMNIIISKADKYFNLTFNFHYNKIIFTNKDMFINQLNFINSLIKNE